MSPPKSVGGFDYRLGFIGPNNHRLISITLFENLSAEQEYRVYRPKQEEDAAGNDGIGQRRACKDIVAPSIHMLIIALF